MKTLFERMSDGLPKGEWPARPMKALTIYQPWASLIMVGAKPYEFRGWNPRERGGSYAALIGQRIVIHASARKIVIQEVLAIRRNLEAGGEEAALTCLHADKAMPILDRALETYASGPYGLFSLDGHGDLPWGVGLGTAVLGEPRNGLDIAEEFGVQSVNDSDRDEHANWGWPMLDVEVWDQPVPMRGLQGFWNWPTPDSVDL